MTINNEKFLAALDAPAALAAKRTPLPILNCVKMSATGGRLTIAGTNIDAYCEMYADCDGDLPETCVNAGQLKQLLSGFGDGEVKMESVGDGGRLALSAEVNGRPMSAKLPTQPPAEFPSAPQVNGTELCVNAEALVAGARSVAWCMSTEQGREYIHGVNLRNNEVCATTGRAVAVATLESGIGERDLFIPSHALALICGSLGEPNARIHDGELSVFYSFDGGMLAVKKREGTFPPYQHVFPKETRLIGAFNAEELASTLRPAVSMYDDTFAHTRLEFTETGCVVSGESSTKKFESTIPGRFEPFKYALDARMLVRAAAEFDGEVEIQAVDDMTPIVFVNGNKRTLICALRW
jgi:DNA polymerase III sliding clamp (beta) subunit (PCNA family)